MVDRQLALGSITPEAAAKVRATAPGPGPGGSTLRATRPAMLAAAMLMIAAESLGLASAWLDDFLEEEVRGAFGVPDDHALCGLLALGFAASEAPFPGRFGLDHACFAEHFGQPCGLRFLLVSGRAGRIKWSVVGNRLSAVSFPAASRKKALLGRSLKVHDTLTEPLTSLDHSQADR